MLTRALVLVGCFVAGAGLVLRAERPEPVPTRETFAAFPMQFGNWKGVQQPPFEKSILQVLGVDDYLTRAYFTPDRSAGAGLYVGYWGSQRQGDTMHSPLNCLPGAGWEPVSQTNMPVIVNNGSGEDQSSIVINRYVIQKGLDRQLVLYWYQSHGRVVASEYWGKFYLIRDAVRLNRTDGALVRVTVPIGVDEAKAETIGVKFVQDLFPLLPGYLPT